MLQNIKKLKGDPSEVHIKKFSKTENFESLGAERLEGGHLEDKKIEKSRTVPKKMKGDPLVSSGFVSYVKNGVNERVTLCINLDAFPVAGPVV